jgi:hypothetical protein
LRRRKTSSLSDQLAEHIRRCQETISRSQELLKRMDELLAKACPHPAKVIATDHLTI